MKIKVKYNVEANVCCTVVNIVPLRLLWLLHNLLQTFLVHIFLRHIHELDEVSISNPPTNNARKKWIEWLKDQQSVALRLERKKVALPRVHHQSQGKEVYPKMFHQYRYCNNTRCLQAFDTLSILGSPFNSQSICPSRKKNCSMFLNSLFTLRFSLFSG